MGSSVSSSDCELDTVPKRIEPINENINKVTQYCTRYCRRCHRRVTDPHRTYYTHTTTNEYLADNEKDAMAKALAHREAESRRIRLQRESEAAEFYRKGQSLWEEAWQAEKSEDSYTAETKFKEAESKFQQASNLHPENGIYSKYVKLAQYKLEGNSEFNEGLFLQEEGNRLQQLKKYVEATEKYVKALEKFKKAASLYKEESERFNECAFFVRDTLNDLKTVINSLNESAKLSVINGLTQLIKETKKVQLEQNHSEHNIDIVFQYLRD